MVTKAKKRALARKPKKSKSALTTPRPQKNSSDFVPLEGGSAGKNQELSEAPATATVLYVGRIPHGFYEDEMEGFFKQFGKIKRLRIARNKKTGRSKHYGFIEFESPEVAKIVADEIHGYLLFEHQLQIKPIPPEKVHPKLWRGMNLRFNVKDWTGIERRRHNKEKTVEQHQHMVQKILKRDKTSRKRVAAAGIDYEFPDFVGGKRPVPKKIRFDFDGE
ncbi:RNA-binding (RRM/RBD/RNP motifs) family protein [Wolffia australiana]